MDAARIFSSKEISAVDHRCTLGPADRPVPFRASDRASADRFYAAGLKAGGKENGGPGPRLDYGPTYYAAFLIGPDGNNVETVCIAKQ
jgi:hypothetical protein